MASDARSTNILVLTTNASGAVELQQCGIAPACSPDLVTGRNRFCGSNCFARDISNPWGKGKGDVGIAERSSTSRRSADYELPPQQLN
jgi:hypothetical protein